MSHNRRRKGLIGVSALFLAVIVAMGLSGILPFRQIIASDRAVELSERKLEALVEENRRLEREVAALQSLEEVERLARENFGLVMPGEIGYVSVPVDASADAIGVLPSTPEDKPWWRAVWDILTGRDLVTDG
ncbi:MAG TPA: septum formation initiator family protein [Acidimicrobiia bacterium]|nr:septum formation initiator family protein [Acidimicrobiia bacterium]